MERACFVTGACGGLGRAVTTALAERGWRVFATDVDAAALEQFAGTAAVRAFRTDVTDAASVRRARERIEESGLGLDGIVCAAGVYVGGPLLDVSDDDVRRSLDINVMGAVTVIRELFPLLRRGSRIVLVSSESTRVVVPFTGPYVITKCALEAYAAALRRELLPFEIRVTVIQPGAIRTPLLDSAARSLAADARLPVYRRALARASSVLAAASRKGMAPARVAAAIVHALRSRRPLRRRRVGNDRPRALLSLLPAPLIDAVMRLFF